MIITGAMAVLFGGAGLFSCAGAMLSLPAVFHILLVANRPDDPLPPIKD